MTRTNVMASSRPQAANAATMRSSSSRARRGLVILPVVLALGLAPAAPVLAAGSATNGYGPGNEPNKPATTPKSGTSPSKSTKSPTTSTPSSETAPSTAGSAPATSTQPAKASANTLPFTGLDLRWTVGAGLLLVGAGGSIMVAQRRQRRDDAGL
jgi:hypothetical protein